MDLTAWIALLRQGDRYLPEADLKKLCRYVCELLCEENNVRQVRTPVTICGDIHGQFYDLLNLFRTGGEVEDGTNYIFMGDFVDRGYNSLETFTLLMLLKAKYPARVTLLRGNHESRQVTTIYGFWDECQKKYGGSEAWRCCTEVFDCLNIAALVDGRVFCVHGGLSPHIRSIDHVRCIDRKQEIPSDGMFCDLMWSDPDERVGTWSVSPRGAGWLFGKKVAKEFAHHNKLDLICRAHQLVEEGFRYHFEGNELVTVWSAPNYCYRCANRAAIFELDDKLGRNVKHFEESPDGQYNAVCLRPTYFL